MVNRIVMLCAALTDHSPWPLWKYRQMTQNPLVTDFAMIAFTKAFGLIEARIEGKRHHITYCSDITEFNSTIFANFLQKHHKGPNETIFVYGGHGMGDYLELAQREEDLQVHVLSSLMGGLKYKGILFDACCMANLECAFHLRNNTNWIAASEGYMWEPDSELEAHIFNSTAASLLTTCDDVQPALSAIQNLYCRQAPLGDLTLINTRRVADFYQRCQELIVPRIYENAFFASDELDGALEKQNQKRFGAARSHDFNVYDQQCWDILWRRIHFPHSFFPFDREHKHLLDLKLWMMDCEKCERLGLLHSLWDEVIFSHVAPQDNKNYATTLHGLSISALEFSCESDPPIQTHHCERFLELFHKEIETRMQHQPST